jgi:Bifunctional DNA primase/polymerase, N-terminal
LHSTTTATFSELVDAVSRRYKIAQACAHLGWRVFPMRFTPDGRKTPTMTKWQRRATIDLDVIHDWWGDPNWVDWKDVKETGKTRWYHDCDVGIATGRESNLWVMDVDTMAHGKADGSTTLRELLVWHDDDDQLPPTFTVRTPSGGFHLYFTYPPNREIKNSAGGTLGSGLDVRGWHGYVVAPRTLRQPKGEYEIVRGLAPAVAPGWLVDLVERRANESDVVPVTTTTNGDHAPAIRQQLAEFLASGFGIGGVGRNDDCYRLSCKLWRLHQFGRIGFDDVMKTLYDIWLMTLGHDLSPPDGFLWQAEAMPTIKNAYRFVFGEETK